MSIQHPEPQLLSEEQKENIRAIAKKYDIDLKGYGVPQDSRGKLKIKYENASIEDIHLDYLELLCLNKNTIEIPKTELTYNSNSHSLAEYVTLLYRAYHAKSDIKVASLTHKESCTIYWGVNLRILWLQANALLYDRYHEIYEAKGVSISPKKVFEYDGINYPEPYSESELNDILTYERSDSEETIKKARKKLKDLLNTIRDYYVTEGVFNSKSKEPSTKEYLFLECGS